MSEPALSGVRSVEVERQVLATRARPLWTLPAAWYEPGCAERMADWIERNVPVNERRWFTYGLPPESSPAALNPPRRSGVTKPCDSPSGGEPRTNHQPEGA